jgi:hypothetical protein
MVDARLRGSGLAVSGLVPSLLLSLVASAAATYLLRRLLATEGRAQGQNQESEQGPRTCRSVNVNVPVVVITIVARNRWAMGRRRGPPPFLLPLLLARVLRAKRRARPGWRRWMG